MKYSTLLLFQIFLLSNFLSAQSAQNSDCVDCPEPCENYGFSTASIDYDLTKTSNNTYSITINNLPENECAIINTFSDAYRYFFYFGDGSYSDGWIPVGATSPYLIPTPHTFFDESKLASFMEITPTKDESEPPRKIFVDNTNGQGTDLNPPSTNQLTIKANRFCVPGQKVTYILTLNPLCEREAREFAGNITFNFDHTMAELSSPVDETSGKEVVATNFATNITPTEIANANSNGTLSINYSSSQLFERLFITVKMKQGICNRDFRVSATHIDACETSDSTALTQLVGCSHDPNKINTINGICLPPPSTMEYTIRFQNIGGMPAKNVVVEYLMSNYFDPTTVKTIDPPGLVGAYDPQMDLISWSLNSTGMLKNRGPLLGTANPSYDDHTSSDSITFQISFYPQMKETIDRCDAIVGTAEIYFDCNKSIFTNKYKTEIMCCKDSCDRCEEYEYFIDEKGVPPIRSGYKHFWYPGYNVDDTQSRNPIFSLGRPRKYTAVASDSENCIREYYYKSLDKNQLNYVKKYPFEVVEDSDFGDCKCTLTINSCDKANPISFTWSYVESGVSTTLPTSQDNYLDLSGRTNVTVKISDGTDEVYFSPSFQNCPERIIPWYCHWWFWLIVAAVFLFGYSIARKLYS